MTTATDKVNLLGLTQPQLESFFESIGEKRFRAGQVMKWIHHFGIDDFDAMSNLGKALKEKLKAAAEIRGPEIVSEDISRDGTRKWVIRVASGSCVETVYIPQNGRGTLCVSSQAGCALDCSFCSTGKQGFNSNLTAAEVIGQVWIANKSFGSVPAKIDRAITNVVMMGMGEPLQNYGALVPALRTMLDDNAYGLSRRRVTVSTSGVVPMMDRLGADCPVALAVSLHAPNDALRDDLVPLNRKYPLAELMSACKRYLEPAPRDFITFEYCMLDGVNDQPEHARQLIELVRTSGVSCKFNLIPFNPFPASGLLRSPAPRVQAFARQVADAGIVTTVRKTRGDDIDAACGQLAGDVKDRTRAAERMAERRVVMMRKAESPPADRQPVGEAAR